MRSRIRSGATAERKRSDEVSPYLTVSCEQVPVRKFQERLPAGCCYLIKLLFPPLLVCWFVGLLVYRRWSIERHRKSMDFAPCDGCGAPLFKGNTRLCPRPKPC